MENLRGSSLLIHGLINLGGVLREKLPRSVRLRYINWGAKERQQRSKPLGIYFSIYCAYYAEGFFGSDLFEGRNPLAFILALIVPFVPKVFFGSDHLKGRIPLAFILDKCAKFADSAYFANLQFYAIYRCWPKLAVYAA